tara:strand:+ start:255 stop:581 length:327 start_codon:yes stop_codon:yes gene_type:complete
MKKIRAANTPDKSNKILLRAMKTAALEVIKYYCPGSFTPGSQKLLESMLKHRGQSQAQAESQSQAQAEGQPQAHEQRTSSTAPSSCCLNRGAKVIIYDESKLHWQLTW